MCLFYVKRSFISYICACSLYEPRHMGSMPFNLALLTIWTIFICYSLCAENGHF